MKKYRPILSWLIAGLAAVCVLLLVHSMAEVAWGQPPMEQNSGALDDEAYGDNRRESHLVWMCNALGLRYISMFIMLSVVAGIFFLIGAIFAILGVTCPNGLVTEIRGLLSQRNCPEVAALIATRSSYLTRLLRAALKNPAMNSFHAWAIMRRTQEYEQAKVRNYIRSFGYVGVLFLLGGISGCVEGAISSFSIIAHGGPKPSELATGISMSLVSASVGFMFTWWTFVFYWILRNCYERFSAKANIVAEELLGEFFTAATRPQ